MITESGFLHTATLAEKEVLSKVKAFLKEEFGIENDVRWSDWSCLRFCRARKFNLELIKEMIRNFIKWYRDNNYDKIGEVDIEKYKPLRDLTLNGYYNTDNYGRPIYIEKVSGLKENEVFKTFDEKSLALYYVQSYERLVNIILPECSKAANKRIEQTLTIMDLDDVNIGKMFAGKVKAFVELASKIGQNYYPEILGNMYIINSGFLFKGIWLFVKPWLDAKTQNKIEIISGSGKKDLAKKVDLNKLPKDIGGTCEISIREDPGPWKEELLLSYKNKTVLHSNPDIIAKYFENEQVAKATTLLKEFK